MTNAFTEQYGRTVKGALQFLLPILLFGLAFYTLPWYVPLLLFVFFLATVEKEYLFALYAGFTFYNVMITEDAPFWASLVTSFIALGIIVARIGTLKRKVPLPFLLTLFLLLVIVLNFAFKTRGAYFFMTGVKSALQLIFILLAIQATLIIPKRYMDPSRVLFDKYLVPFLAIYLATSLLFHDFSNRFDGGTGAQCLALQLALVIGYLCTSASRRSFQLLLLVPLFLTGSRTYLILACVILAYDYLKSSPLRIKVIILANIALLAIAALIILPYTDSRFNYTTDTFAGSFWGRFHNYEHGLKLVAEHPVTGNGMGSILRVLETWVNREGFQHYKAKGDTTIIHNEYLRILIELGLVGFFLIGYGLVLVWRRFKSLPARYMLFVFLLASLVENTLTLYTTGTLFFVLLLAFTPRTEPGAPQTIPNKP